MKWECERRTKRRKVRRRGCASVSVSDNLEVGSRPRETKYYWENRLRAWLAWVAPQQEPVSGATLFECASVP